MITRKTHIIVNAKQFLPYRKIACHDVFIQTITHPNVCEIVHVITCITTRGSHWQPCDKTYHARRR